MDMRRVWAWYLSVGAIALLTGGCKKSQQMPAPPPPNVTVSTPLDREVMEWDEYTGRLEAKEWVEVRPRVSGYIESVHFKEGRIVKAGDPLFVIDPRPYQAELDRAKAEVDRATARLALADTEFKRTQGLVRTADASELELEERKAQLAEARATQAAGQAAVTSAELNVEFTDVRAEIEGRTSRIYITPGNLVTGGQGAGGQATLLTTITSLDPIYCYVDADERSVLKYQDLARTNRRPDVRREDVKIPAKLALLNEQEFAHSGYIDFVDNRIDPTTGTLRGRAVFENPGGTMTPGMFGRMRIPGTAPYRTLLIAEQVIQADQNRRYVFTVDAQDVVQITPIELGASFGALRAVKSGLKGDERIVVNGMLRARPGAKVHAVAGPMPGAGDAETLATTRVVEPSVNAATQPSVQPTTNPTTAPTTRPAPGGAEPDVERRQDEDRAAEAAPAGGGSFAVPVLGVAPEVGR